MLDRLRVWLWWRSGHSWWLGSMETPPVGVRLRRQRWSHRLAARVLRRLEDRGWGESP